MKTSKNLSHQQFVKMLLDMAKGLFEYLLFIYYFFIFKLTLLICFIVRRILDI